MIYQIAATRIDKDGNETIVLDVQSIIAENAHVAEMMAVRQLPEGIDLNEVRVMTVPFISRSTPQQRGVAGA